MEQEYTDIAEQNERLLEERVLLKENDEEHKKVISTFRKRVGDMYSKMMDLIKAGNALQKELAKLKRQDPLMIEDVKQQFIKEYKSSLELAEEVIRQFSEGYQSARAKDKEKMLAAGLDPNILKSSDDEDDAEELPPSST